MSNIFFIFSRQAPKRTGREEWCYRDHQFRPHSCCGSFTAYKFHPTIIFSTFWPGPALLLEPCHTCPRTNLSTDTRLLFFYFFPLARFFFLFLFFKSFTGQFRENFGARRRKRKDAAGLMACVFIVYVWCV